MELLDWLEYCASYWLAPSGTILSIAVPSFVKSDILKCDNVIATHSVWLQVDYELWILQLAILYG